jgi:hypothetical protein
LSPARVEVKRCRICYIAPSVIRNDRDVITDLVLVWISFERIEQIAHCDVRRPRYARVGAVRIEELRICVVRSISRVVPDSVQASIGRYRKCPKPVPLARVNRIVIDLVRRAEGQPAVRAAHKHYVSRASPGRHHAGQHVNVVVSRTSGTIDRQE